MIKTPFRPHCEQNFRGGRLHVRCVPVSYIANSISPGYKRRRRSVLLFLRARFSFLFDTARQFLLASVTRLWRSSTLSVAYPTRIFRGARRRSRLFDVGHLSYRSCPDFGRRRCPPATVSTTYRSTFSFREFVLRSGQNGSLFWRQCSSPLSQDRMQDAG